MANETNVSHVRFVSSVARVTNEASVGRVASVEYVAAEYNVTRIFYKNKAGFKA